VAEDQILHVGINALVQALSKEIFKTSNPIEPETAEESRLNTFSRVDRLDAAVNGQALLQWDEANGVPPRIQLDTGLQAVLAQLIETRQFDGIHDTLNGIMKNLIIPHPVSEQLKNVFGKPIKEPLAVYGLTGITDIGIFTEAVAFCLGVRGVTDNAISYNNISNKADMQDAAETGVNITGAIHFLWDKLQQVIPDSGTQQGYVPVAAQDGTLILREFKSQSLLSSPTNTITASMSVDLAMPSEYTMDSFKSLLCVLSTGAQFSIVHPARGALSAIIPRGRPRL
jgi:hypothetical protein